jgi:hypothetical protein
MSGLATTTQPALQVVFRGQRQAYDEGLCEVGKGSLASDLTYQRHVRLNRNLGHGSQ